MSALQEWVNQLPKRPLSYKISVLLAALGVLGLLYYQFFYSDLSDRKAELEQQRSVLLEKQRKLNIELEEQKKLAQQNEELQRIIRDNQKALPTEAELPAFFDHLQRKAGDAGVSIRRWERREEETVDIYTRVPVAMEISGTFYNIMQYFALLGPQLKRPESQAANQETRVDERIVSIEDLELGEPALKEGEVFLTAKFIASTFRQQGPDTQGAAAGAAANTPGQPPGAQPPAKPPAPNQGSGRNLTEGKP